MGKDCDEKEWSLEQKGRMVYSHLNRTRSYAALRAADLDWIVGPGYSLGGTIWKKKHENQPRTMKNHEKPTWNHEKP